MNMGFPDRLLALERLAAGPVELSGPLRADREAWDLDDVRLEGDPLIDLRIEETGDGAVRLRGRLVVDVEQECRRCLDPVRSQVGLDLDLRFDPNIGPEEETEALYALDPKVAELDLLPALREELLLALPDFALCRDGCRGLCPLCGTNRNEDDCDCRIEATDPRWDALREKIPSEPDAATGAGDGSGEN
ncbi:MAG: DUF177 domain-containing protein [marine benthic group bacterium]|nr:DUF177 domain-containing protein [Gemmatimonadota bacterium]MCL7937843.1 DUF177 domain-containing protein [Gemmatimonadota bacterium]MCL7957124.1 DUF177 domain-containing protein [Gemmatimonadota bacterium]MCL7964378.1 DUF177 domain-containing protein [Gemmatimonadota bacterium]MCL7973682.1 DUF177 domain-containing protein [Gemmatimonadota bacterium]